MKIPPEQEIEYLKIIIEENRAWGCHKIADLLAEELHSLVVTPWLGIEMENQNERGSYHGSQE